MSNFNIVLTVVPHGNADRVSEVAVAAGSFGGTVTMGRGITRSPFLAALGVGDNSRDIVIILSECSKTLKIVDALRDGFCKRRRNFGEIYVLESDSMLKGGVLSANDVLHGGSSMASRCLITIILNKGYADDAMAAARKAGAGGGTVINARGTAKEDDAKFFGIHIVPEKEMLMIVVEQEKKDAVLEAMRTLPCLSAPGSGIAFCSDVVDFSLLGKK